MKIIKVLLLVAVILFSTSTLQSQIRFGLKGGANFSSISFKNSTDWGNTTGYTIGPMLEVMLPIVGLGVDGGVMFSQAGAKSPVVDGSQKLKLNYIDAPINIKWKFGLPIIKLFLTAGPKFSFLVNDNFKDFNIEKVVDLNKYDTSISVGGGLELFKSLQVGLNYNWGLNDTFKHITSKNNITTVSAAYLF